LPLSLLALLFASPVLTDYDFEEPEPTSFNDPFRVLELNKPKQPENPICCLKPLTPSDPVDDGILLSFEEWKMKQLASQSEVAPLPTEELATGGEGAVINDSGSGTETPVPPAEDVISTDSPNSNNQALSGPRFRVPLTDRFNYASTDCSARVHTAHRSAKSPSAILSSKRDRYMLSPCDKSKEKQYVIVELCDDIRIDTVQLANFEFFSGVFKDFTVSVAKTLYTTDPEGWTPVATYRAKNVRGVQSFHPPNSLRDFYRYIRIDFLSHYGNEYYCPVSLLRVYGLTHLEEWKWDTWEAESRMKQADLQKKRQPIVPIESTTISSTISANTTPSVNAVTEKHASTDDASISSDNGTLASGKRKLVEHAPDTKASIPSNTPIQHATPPPVTPKEDAKAKPYPSNTTESPKQTTEVHEPQPEPSQSQDASIIPNTPADISSTQIPASATSASLTFNTASASAQHASPTGVNASHTPSTVHQGSPTIVITSTSATAAVIIPPPPPVPPLHPTSISSKGGESIYRTILNRLAEVELNQTLYMRYIEQQNIAIREVIKRLGEDLGRLEGINRAQSSTYQRTMYEWESDRYQLEMEYNDLVSRVDSLSEEILLEKRLGIAQLCLLLAVLIFLGLTRGSRAEAVIVTRSNGFNQSVREWGKRHFKLSGDWANRLKGKTELSRRESSRSRSRSVSPDRTPSRPRRKSTLTKPVPPRLPLRPYREKENRGKEPLEPIQLNTAPASRETFNRTRTTSNPRSRVPSLRSTPTANRRSQHGLHLHHPKPTTPTTAGFRPQMLQRSSSHHGVQSGSWGPLGAMPKSAKKWARTAHLHEVKTP
ncbi:hypothetical protein CPC08DRAFT_601232, partial [Agrocybe pediades]